MRLFEKFCRSVAAIATVMGLVLVVGQQDAKASWAGPQTWLLNHAGQLRFDRGSITHDDVTTYSQWKGAGGEFRISENLNSTGSQFFTYCVQKDLTISLPGSYDFSLDFDILGNPGAGPLKALTSAIYRDFLRLKSGENSIFDSSLSYNQIVGSQNNTNSSNAQMMQEAIWMAQGQLTPATNAYYDAAVSYFSSNGIALTLNASEILASNLSDAVKVAIGGVQVLNLRSGTADRQSQLVYLGTPTSSLAAIPEPASVTMFMCGLAGFCGFLRRRKAA